MLRRQTLFAALLIIVALVLNACGAPADASKSRSDALIQSGSIPPAQELRVAEYLNYYKQDFPAPTDTSVGLDTRVGNPQIPATGSDAWLQIGLRARDAGAQQIAPLNLALVIDRSGSMDTPDKMPYLKTSLGVFLRSLAPNDFISIVTYSNSADVLVPTQPVGDGRWIESTINRITPDGSTNLYDGLVQGMEQVARNYDARRNNRVILLTDGIANVGVTDPGQIAATAKQYNDRGIYLATIGLGHEFNDALLSQLATQGKGGYHFVGSAADMDKIFRDEVSGLQQKAASNLNVALYPADGVRVLQITGLDGVPPAGNLNIKLQDMGTGDTQIVLAHLSVAPGVTGARVLANVELRYDDLLRQHPDTVTRVVTVDAVNHANPDPLVEVRVLRNVTIQQTAEGLKEIDRLYRAQKYLDAWNLAAQLEYNLRRVSALLGDAQLSKDADTMHQYQNTLAPWVQKQNGFYPQYTPAPDAFGNRLPTSSLERLPTFTPASTDIEIK